MPLIHTPRGAAVVAVDFAIDADPDAAREIDALLDFVERNRGRPAMYDPETGIMKTDGCEGGFGGCCSNSFDLDALVDALARVRGRR